MKFFLGLVQRGWLRLRAFASAASGVLVYELRKTVYALRASGQFILPGIPFIPVSGRSLECVQARHQIFRKYVIRRTGRILQAALTDQRFQIGLEIHAGLSNPFSLAQSSTTEVYP